MANEIRLPELGENVDSGTVVEISVKTGDEVSEGQTLLEVEAGKSTVPVPSPSAGKISEVLVKTGEEVKTNQLLFKLDGAESKSSSPTSSPKSESTAEKKEDTKPKAESKPPESTGSGEYDAELVVIGGGPGGYAAAFLAADKGMNVTLVEKDARPGGVCLHCGCIPSKALLHAAKVIAETREAEEWGLHYSEPKIDIDKMRDKKDSIIDMLSGHLAHVAKQRKVNYIQATATFENSNTLSLDNGDKLTFKNCILATGSSPTKLPHLNIDSPKVLDSTSVLKLETVPKSMLVIGGGYIGLEMGTVYASLGCKVSVVELMGSLLPGVDADLVKPLHKRLSKLFDKIMLNTKVVKVEDVGDGIKVSFDGEDLENNSMVYDRVLVAIGRRPNSKNLGLENTRVEVDDKGFVVVDEYRRTTDSKIFAIGDVAGEPMLAHKASAEGKLAVQVLAGEPAMWDVRAIPAVVFTDPEIAWAGITENEAKKQGIEYQVAKFDWAYSGRATTLGRNDGVSKIIFDPETDRILGIGLAGAGVGEMIAEAVLAIEMGATTRDLAMSIHPHPTLTESVMEASESVHGLATHLFKPKR